MTPSKWSATNEQPVQPGPFESSCGCKRLASIWFPLDVTVFHRNARPRLQLAPSLHLSGKRRNTYTGSKRLITRRSQVQILPPRYSQRPC
jgi:hypothetical protein